MPFHNQNFKMAAGESIFLLVQVFEDDEPLNLAGSTISWAMQRSRFTEEPFLLKSTGAGIAIQNDTEFVVHIEPADTDALKGDRKFYHEARVTDSEGNVSTVLTGQARIMASAFAG